MDLTMNAHPAHFHSETVEATLSTDGQTVNVPVTTPETGFLVTGIRAEVYDADGAVIDSVILRGRIAVQVKTTTAPVLLYTQEAVDIFSLNTLDRGVLWRGWYFSGKRNKTTWQFTPTVIGTDPNLPVTARVHLFGYQADEKMAALLEK